MGGGAKPKVSLEEDRIFKLRLQWRAAAVLNQVYTIYVVTQKFCGYCTLHAHKSGTELNEINHCEEARSTVVEILQHFLVCYDCER